MPNDIDQLLGKVFDFGSEGQYRAVDFRESKTRGVIDLELEAENPNKRKLSKSISLGQLDQRMTRGSVTPGVPDPRRVHEDRSEYAQKQDEARDAKLTTDPEEYATDPNSLDFPGVDTGPMFRQKEGEFDSESFLDRIL